MSKPGEAHLEIHITKQGGDSRIEGEGINVVLAWMRLSAIIADTAHIPLSELLAWYEKLGTDIDRLNKATEDCRIDLSKPLKI